jgi:hypothetical protein
MLVKAMATLLTLHTPTRRNRYLSFLQSRLPQRPTQVLHDLLDESYMRSWKNRQIISAFAGSRQNDGIFLQKF